MTLILSLFFADEEETPNIIIIMQCYLNTKCYPLVSRLVATECYEVMIDIYHILILVNMYRNMIYTTNIYYILVRLSFGAFSHHYCYVAETCTSIK